MRPSSTPRCGCCSSPAAARWGPSTRPKRPGLTRSFLRGRAGSPRRLIFRDAPLPQAVNFVVRRAFLNGGQYCTTIKRVYVHRDIYQAVKELVLGMMPEIKVGDPGDPATWIGPIRVERTRLLLDRALAALDHPRFLFEPRRDGEWQGPFLVEVAEPPDLELFGPFLALVPVQSDEEALSRVLRSRYPFLAAWFGTPPPGGKQQLAGHLRYDLRQPGLSFYPPATCPSAARARAAGSSKTADGILTKRDGAFLYSAELVRS